MAFPLVRNSRKYDKNKICELNISPILHALQVLTRQETSQTLIPLLFDPITLLPISLNNSKIKKIKITNKFLLTTIRNKKKVPAHKF